MLGADGAQGPVDDWIEVAQRRGVAIVVIDAPSGYGKSFTVQQLYDTLASDGSSSYWLPGLTPVWPPSTGVSLESGRKTIVPPDGLRERAGAKNFGFAGVGLALGEVGSSSLDPDSLLLGQLARLRVDRVAALSQEISDTRRQEARRATVAKAGRAAMSLLPAVPAVLDLAGSLADTASEGAGVVQLWRRARRDPSLDLRIEAEQRVQDLIREVTATPSGISIPLIVAIDDLDAASGAVVSLLQLVTGISAEDETAISGLPAHGAPVLVVLTMERADTTGSPAFDDWMSSARRALAAGADPTEEPAGTFEVELEPMLKEEAASLLNEASAVPSSLVRPVLDHLARHRAGAAVNPLVLAEAVCEITEWASQAKFGDFAFDSLVPSLSTAPTAAAQRRLAQLRGVPGGELAAGLVSQLAQWGPIVPCAVAQALLDARAPDWRDRLDELVDILRNHGVVGPVAEPDTYPVLQMQVDLHRFLVERAVGIGDIAQVARSVCDELLTRVLPGEGDPSIPAWLVGDTVRTAQRLAPIESFVPPVTDLTAAADTSELLLAGAWALGGKIRAGLDDAQIGRLQLVVARSGTTGWACAAGIAAARYVPSQQAIELLEPLAARDEHAAIALAALEPARALEILAPWERLSPHVAARVVKIDPDRAEDLLWPWVTRDVKAATRLAEQRPDLEGELVEPLAKRNLEAASWLANRHPERAVELLGPWTRQHAVAAIRLAELHPEMTDNLLEGHAANDPNAAVRLVALNPDRAVDLLTEHAKRSPNAAARLATLHPEQAEQVLDPLVDRFVGCAFRLAELRPDRAVDLLTRWALTDEAAAQRLYALDPVAGLPYMARHDSRPSVAIVLSREDPARAVDLLARHIRNGQAMAALAALAPRTPPMAMALHELRGGQSAAVEALAEDSSSHPAIRLAANGAFTCAQREAAVPIIDGVGPLALFDIWQQAWSAGFAAAAAGESDPEEAWKWAVATWWPEPWQPSVLADALARRAIELLSGRGQVSHWEVDDLVARVWPKRARLGPFFRLYASLRRWAADPYSPGSPWLTIEEVLSVVAVARSLEHLILEEQSPRWWTVPYLDAVEAQLAARLGSQLVVRRDSWSALCPELFLLADSTVPCASDPDLAEESATPEHKDWL